MNIYDNHTGGGAAGPVIGFPKEPWVTKQQLADYLQFSIRWVELRVQEGMPHAPFPGPKRFKISEVEAWLSGRCAA